MNDASFDPMFGWIMPSDVHESDTTASLKEVMAALKRANKGACLLDELYDAAERLLYIYANLVRQGVRERITTSHTGVTWYLTLRDERAFISYQDGPRAEWLNECYADEVPLWLLIGLFCRIARRKPLRDAQADVTIKKVRDMDAAYVRTKREESLRGIRLTTRPTFFEKDP